MDPFSYPFHELSYPAFSGFLAGPYLARFWGGLWALAPLSILFLRPPGSQMCEPCELGFASSAGNSTCYPCDVLAGGCLVRTARKARTARKERNECNRLEPCGAARSLSASIGRGRLVVGPDSIFRTAGSVQNNAALVGLFLGLRSDHGQLSSLGSSCGVSSERLLRGISDSRFVSLGCEAPNKTEQTLPRLSFGRRLAQRAQAMWKSAPPKEPLVYLPDATAKGPWRVRSSQVNARQRCVAGAIARVAKRCAVSFGSE